MRDIAFKNVPDVVRNKVCSGNVSVLRTEYFRCPEGLKFYSLFVCLKPGCHGGEEQRNYVACVRAKF